MVTKVVPGIFALFLLCGCAGTISFPALGEVTKAEVRTRENTLIRRIQKEEEVTKLVEFVDRHRSGWEAPAGGVPVPEYVVNLYAGEEFRGHFGCGRGFFETQRDGRGFFSKEVPTYELEEFQSLIGVR